MPEEDRAATTAAPATSRRRRRAEGVATRRRRRRGVCPVFRTDSLASVSQGSAPVGAAMGIRAHGQIERKIGAPERRSAPPGSGPSAGKPSPGARSSLSRHARRSCSPDAGGARLDEPLCQAPTRLTGSWGWGLPSTPFYYAYARVRARMSSNSRAVGAALSGPDPTNRFMRVGSALNAVLLRVRARARARMSSNSRAVGAARRPPRARH
jgi:hypothetical protein